MMAGYAAVTALIPRTQWVEDLGGNQGLTVTYKSSFSIVHFFQHVFLSAWAAKDHAFKHMSLYRRLHLQLKTNAI